MKKIIYIVLMFVFCIGNVSAESDEVKFSSCVDGDTIKVMIDEKEYTVRFLAIDTPESVHPTKGVEYYGKEASDYTCNMVKNAKELKLEYDENSDKLDKYDRLLAWVFVDNQLLQDLLIKEGYAEVAYLFGDYKYTTLIQDHEGVAKSQKIGVWNDEEREKYEPQTKSAKDDITTKDIIYLLLVIVVVVIFGNNKKIKKALKIVKKIK